LNKLLTQEELGEDLCNWCPLDDDAKGTHSGPNGPISCEGGYCAHAYVNYLEENKTDEDTTCPES